MSLEAYGVVWAWLTRITRGHPSLSVSSLTQTFRPTFGPLRVRCISFYQPTYLRMYFNVIHVRICFYCTTCRDFLTLASFTNFLDFCLHNSKRDDLWKSLIVDLTSIKYHRYNSNTNYLLFAFGIHFLLIFFFFVIVELICDKEKRKKGKERERESFRPLKFYTFLRVLTCWCVPIRRLIREVKRQRKREKKGR